ncbi:MAG: (2Fe-2S)-binding protein [Treponema sp.]|jgi:carbon-monoxide dehydrogenase small subunit|nr:(2Fe-2S)-binding protein [Treponema sp.]
MNKILKFVLNGDPMEIACESNVALIDLIRDHLGLTGTKKGCEEGECGACTVLFDGNPINSCLALAHEINGHEIITVEGIAKDGELHPLQKEFIKRWAFQCGYCTPGMVMSAKALLDKNQNPTEYDVREAISGNLCRCTGYVKYVEAILAVAADMRKEAKV